MEEQQFNTPHFESKIDQPSSTDMVRTHKASQVAGNAEVIIDEVLESKEQKMIEKLRVTRLVGGLNFGEGLISKEDRLNSFDDQLDDKVIRKVEQAIQDKRILVPIEASDDGCGDGRFVKQVKQGQKTFERTLNRAKVFGGGLTMAVAARIGLAETQDVSLEQAFVDTIKILNEIDLEYGAHTDEHAHGDNCGCGAIDKAPIIIANATKFKKQICGAISLLTNQKNNSVLNEILDSYETYALTIKSQPYRGSIVMQRIMQDNRVVKELGGPHLETHIIINTVPKTTVNQEYIREISGNKAQVFGVDAWRMQDIAAQLYSNDFNKQEKAYLSMLVYTLATAGTLTKGDLPVYVVEQ